MKRLSGSLKKKTDETLIKMIADRDERALKDLEKRYGAYIYDIISRFISDPEEIKECLNDVYLDIWNSLSGGVRLSLMGYISKIARNTAIDRYRENMTQKRIALCRSESIEDCDDKALRLPSVEEEYDALMLKESINRFVGSLPERRRYIFISKYYFQDSIDSIAKSLEISESTVTKELFKIKKMLKKTLKREGFDYD